MPQTAWLDSEELRVIRAFTRASNAVLSAVDRELDNEHELPRTYFDLLWRLRRAPDRSMRLSQLARETSSKPSRITHALTVLERKGLVAREAVPGDRRGAVALLTQRGLEEVEAAAPTYVNGVRTHLLASLTPGERATLASLLEKVLLAIDADALNDSGTAETARA